MRTRGTALCSIKTLSLMLLLSAAGFGQAGLITTIAGRTPPGGAPVRGFSGDGAAGTSAQLALANIQNTCDPVSFQQTMHLAADAAGNVYFTDSDNQRIRKIDTQGNISTVAGSGANTSPDSRCQPTASVQDGGSPL